MGGQVNVPVDIFRHDVCIEYVFCIVVNILVVVPVLVKDLKVPLGGHSGNRLALPVWLFIRHVDAL